MYTYSMALTVCDSRAYFTYTFISLHMELIRSVFLSFMISHSFSHSVCNALVIDCELLLLSQHHVVLS